MIHSAVVLDTIFQKFMRHDEAKMQNVSPFIFPPHACLLM